MSIYDYQATLENGETYSLAKYEGQLLSDRQYSYQVRFEPAVQRITRSL